MDMHGLEELMKTGFKENTRQHEELKKMIQDLTGDVQTQRDRITVHEERLKQGAQIFAEHGDRLRQVEDDTDEMKRLVSFWKGKWMGVVVVFSAAASAIALFLAFIRVFHS